MLLLSSLTPLPLHLFCLVCCFFHTWTIGSLLFSLKVLIFLMNFSMNSNRKWKRNDWYRTMTTIIRQRSIHHRPMRMMATSHHHRHQSPGKPRKVCIYSQHCNNKSHTQKENYSNEIQFFYWNLLLLLLLFSLLLLSFFCCCFCIDFTWTSKFQIQNALSIFAPIHH